MNMGKLLKALKISILGFLGLIVITAVASSIGVKTRSDEVRQTIQYTTERINDNTLPKGQKKVLVKGAPGEKLMIYEVRHRGSSELSRELKSEQIIKQPITEKVAIGTYVEPTPEPQVSAPSASSAQSTPKSSTNVSSNSNSSSSNNNNAIHSPNSGVTNIVSGHCMDGKAVTGNPSAKGKSNPCYGHGGWRDY